MSVSRARSRGVQGTFAAWLPVALGVSLVFAYFAQTYGVVPAILYVLLVGAGAWTTRIAWRAWQSLRSPQLEEAPQVVDAPTEALEHEKELLLASIKELEADYATGKVDEADYQDLRQSAESQALSVMAALRARQRYWMNQAEQLAAERSGLAPRFEAEGPKERVMPARPVAPSAGGAPVAQGDEADARVFAWDDTTFVAAEGALLECSVCQAANPASVRYCSGCGRPRAQEAA